MDGATGTGGKYRLDALPGIGNGGVDLVLDVAGQLGRIHGLCLCGGRESEQRGCDKGKKLILHGLVPRYASGAFREFFHLRRCGCLLYRSWCLRLNRCRRLLHRRGCLLHRRFLHRGLRLNRCRGGGFFHDGGLRGGGGLCR